MTSLNILKYVVSFFIVVAMFYEAITIYFLVVGGVIIWASPLIPMSEWGQSKIWYPITLEIVLLMSLILILRDKFAFLSKLKREAPSKQRL